MTTIPMTTPATDSSNDSKHYYKLYADTAQGRQLRDFWREAQRVDGKAEAYAKKMGAVAFHTSPTAFAGGVEFLVFPTRTDADGKTADRVDTEAWRMAAELNGERCYEPNVKMRTCVYMLPSDRFTPSNTSRRIFQRRHCKFEEVSKLHTVRQWYEIGGIPWNPQHTDELRQSILRQRLGKRTFVLYNEYEGMSLKPMSAKRAVKAEVLRAQLPVVGNERFYLIFGVPDGDIPLDADTPTFFVYDGAYYIGVPMAIDADCLEEITAQRYTFCKNTALREAELRERLRNEDI